MALLDSRNALWLLAALTLAFGLAALPALGTISDRGAGILDFELARTSARAAEIVARWGEEGRSAARQSLWLDYPFLIGYGLLVAAEHTAQPWPGIAFAFASGKFALSMPAVLYALGCWLATAVARPG